MENFSKAESRFNKMKMQCIQDLNADPRTIDIVIKYGENFLKLYSTGFITASCKMSRDLVYLRFLRDRLKNQKMLKDEK